MGYFGIGGNIVGEDYNKYEKLFKWSVLKAKLHEKFLKNNQAKWEVPRRSIYGCYLGENVGFEKNGLDSRPVLVVSSDLINKTNGIVVVIPLTKKIKWDTTNPQRQHKLKYDWHYVLYKQKYHKLNYDSAIQCEDIRVVSKARLGDFICFIDDKDMKEVSKRLKKALQI